MSAYIYAFVYNHRILNMTKLMSRSYNHKHCQLHYEVSVLKGPRFILCYPVTKSVWFSWTLPTTIEYTDPDSQGEPKKMFVTIISSIHLKPNSPFVSAIFSGVHLNTWICFIMNLTTGSSSSVLSTQTTSRERSFTSPYCLILSRKMLGIEPTIFCMPGICSMTEPWTLPKFPQELV